MSDKPIDHERQDLKHHFFLLLNLPLHLCSCHIFASSIIKRNPLPLYHGIAPSNHYIRTPNGVFSRISLSPSGIVWGCGLKIAATSTQSHTLNIQSKPSSPNLNDETTLKSIHQSPSNPQD